VLVGEQPLGVDMGEDVPSGARAVAPDGLVIVDKPTGWTSHDVVARIRTLARTRRVGHAGTLDPMATGVLVVGIGRATRLLGHISGHDKAYSATIRLGSGTVSDDAQGERTWGAPADGLTMQQVLPAVERLTGPILQRPSAVSAIKVAGRRAHDRVRAGETVHLPARPVLVSVFDIEARRADPGAGALELDATVVCSSGTYVRALARDLGEALGVGGHLVALRRTRVGGFYAEEAHDLASLEKDLAVIDLSTAARSAFPVLAVGPAQALAVCHGRAIDLTAAWAPFRDLADGAEGWTDAVGPFAVLDEQGQLLALAAPNPDLSTRYLAVFGQP
jgi:tRNA pseudouridine55 synthase